VLHVTYWSNESRFSSDNKEPPPSYQDAISDYDNSPIRPSVALSGDDHQSMRRYMQCRGDDKSLTLGVASDELQRRSEEGAPALEQHWNLQAPCPKNDRDVSESAPLPVEAEDVLRTHQEITSGSLSPMRMQANMACRIERVSWASKTDEERVLDQHFGVVSRECAKTVREPSSQCVTDTRSADGFHLAADGPSSSQLHSSPTSTHDDVDASSSHEVYRETSSSERSASQEYVSVVRSDDCKVNHLSLARACITTSVGSLKQAKVTMGTTQRPVPPRKTLRCHPRYLHCRDPNRQCSSIAGWYSRPRSRLTRKSHGR